MPAGLTEFVAACMVCATMADCNPFPAVASCATVDTIAFAIARGSSAEHSIFTSVPRANASADCFLVKH